MTEDDIRAIATDYEKAQADILEERDAKLRQAIAEGWRQKEIAELTRYSRETLRRALNPEVREAVRRQRAEKAGQQ